MLRSRTALVAASYVLVAGSYYDRSELVEDDDPRWLRIVPFVKAPAEDPEDDAAFAEVVP